MFDVAHIHVMIVHLPIIGTVLAMIPLLWWLYKKDASIKWIGLVLLAVSLVWIPLATSSGESTEQAFFDGTISAPLDDAGMQILELHSEVAEYAEAFWFVIFALIALQLFLWKKNYAWKNRLFWITLVANFFLIGWLGYVGYLGGQIRHPEFRATISSEVGVANIAKE